MTDATKTSPNRLYTCNGGYGGDCESDEDCMSYCRNTDQKAPYFCHLIRDEEPEARIADGPAKCESDSDCKSCVLVANKSTFVLSLHVHGLVSKHAQELWFVCFLFVCLFVCLFVVCLFLCFCFYILL